MSEKLKSCPFCNSAGIVKVYRTGVRVKCTKCGVISGKYDTKDKAIAAWNTRLFEETKIAAYDALNNAVKKTLKNITDELEALELLLKTKEE